MSRNFTIDRTQFTIVLQPNATPKTYNLMRLTRFGLKFVDTCRTLAEGEKKAENLIEEYKARAKQIREQAQEEQRKRGIL